MLKKEHEKSPERLPSKSLPMSISALTNEILKDIVRIYDQVADSDYAREFVADPADRIGYVQEIFSYGNAVEWRFGSRLSSDTKMFISKTGWTRAGDDVIRFAFDPNSYVSDPKDINQTEFEQMVQDFRNQVDQYLTEHDLVSTEE